MGKTCFCIAQLLVKKMLFFFLFTTHLRTNTRFVVGVLCDSNVKWCGYQGKGNPAKTFGVPLRGYPWVQIRKPDIGSY